MCVCVCVHVSERKGKRVIKRTLTKEDTKIGREGKRRKKTVFVVFVDCHAP